MLTIQDKLIYASYSAIVALFLCLLSKYYHRDSQVKRDENKKGVIRVNIPVFLCSMIIIIIVILFCAFREIGIGIGGTDAYAYKMDFIRSTGSLVDLGKSFKGWEPLYALSLWIVRSFTDNYVVYLVLYYLVLAVLMINCSKIFRFKFTSFLSIFGLVIFSLDSFNTLRNTMATFIGILIIKEIRENNYKKALILSIVVTLTHYSSAIYFFAIAGFYFLKYIKGKYERKLIIYVSLSLVISVVVSNYIPTIIGGSRLSVYKSESNVSIPMLLAFVFLMVYQYMNRRKFDEDLDISVLSTVLITFAPMFVFQLYYSIMYRMMLFAIPIMYLLISEYKKNINPTKKLRDLAYYIVFNLILILKIAPIFTESYSNIGAYSSVLFK